MHACADHVLVSLLGCANHFIELVVGVIAEACEREAGLDARKHLNEKQEMSLL